MGNYSATGRANSSSGRVKSITPLKLVVFVYFNVFSIVGSFGRRNGTTCVAFGGLNMATVLNETIPHFQGDPVAKNMLLRTRQLVVMPT